MFKIHLNWPRFKFYKISANKMVLLLPKHTFNFIFYSLFSKIQNEFLIFTKELFSVSITFGSNYRSVTLCAAAQISKNCTKAEIFPHSYYIVNIGEDKSDVCMCFCVRIPKFSPFTCYYGQWNL